MVERNRLYGVSGNEVKERLNWLFAGKETDRGYDWLGRSIA